MASGLSGRPRARRWPLALVGAALALAACGEEDPDVDIPARDSGQAVLDHAGVLDESVEEALSEVDGWDVIAVTYETPQASAGEAHRAGEEAVDAWGADIALVAVAEPGDFTSAADDRRRYFGATPADVRAVPADLREALADEVVPPHAADNDWAEAFAAAAERLAEELE